MGSLHEIARALVAPGKGILAADESDGTIKKRFDSIGLSSTVLTRRDYRQMLFTANEAMQNYISGVILYEETLDQTTRDGTPFSYLLREQGAIAGIKVDRGAYDMPGSPDEKITEGLDGLRQRLKEYAQKGAQFAKWRGVIAITENAPSRNAIRANAHALARYAMLCQEAGLVPIVEPEVLADGSPGDHSIQRCADVTSEALEATFKELRLAGVDLSAIILKPNMVTSGIRAQNQAGITDVASATLDVLRAQVPAAVPGIAFLSGGQSADLASAHLAAMNSRGALPWALTFSYGRALQSEALKAWAGRDENVPTAQAAFTERARINSLAALGQTDAQTVKAA